MNIDKSYWLGRLKELIEAKKTDPKPDPRLVSTRQPEGEPKFGEKKLTQSYERIAAEEPKIVPKIAKALSTLHIAGPESALPSKPEEVVDLVGRRMEANIEDTINRHGNIDSSVMTSSAGWYPTAKRYAGNWSQKHGVKSETVTGMISVSSPQNPWPSNVAQAERTLVTMSQDIPNGRTGWTPGMSKESERIREQTIKLSKGNQDPEDSKLLGHLEAIQGKSWDEVTEGKPFHELTDEHFERLGTWVRLHSTANHPQGMREPLPSGGFGDFIKTAKGEHAKIKWQSSNNLGKMVKLHMADALPDQERSKVHDVLLGRGPKVRSFYNNQIQPDAGSTPSGEPQDVTVDIHTGADALGRGDLTSSLAGALRKRNYPDTSFTKDFGGMIMSGAPKSKQTGNVGIYGVVGDALRRVAGKLGYGGSAIQSMGWVARKLGSDAIQADPDSSEQVRQMHRDMRSGDLSFDQFRSKYNDLIMSHHKQKPLVPTWKTQQQQADSSFLEEKILVEFVYKLLKVLNEESAAWQRKEGKNPKGGLNEKGRKSYERENPGSDLKRPQPEGGKRRDSFCRRMKGMKKKLTSAKTANDPNSRINKSLRAWNC